MDVRASLTGYFTDEAIDAVVKRYGERGPRRLVLTAALLVTGREAAIRAKREAVKRQALNNALDKVAELSNAVPQDELALKKAREELEKIEAHIQREASTLQPPSTAEDVAEYKFVTDVRAKLSPRNSTNFYEEDATCMDELNRVRRFLL